MFAFSEDQSFNKELPVQTFLRKSIYSFILSPALKKKPFIGAHASLNFGVSKGARIIDSYCVCLVSEKFFTLWEILKSSMVLSD